MAEIGPLWSARQNRGPAAEPLSTVVGASLFASMIADLWERGDLQEAFGIDCVDSDELYGALGSSPKERLLLETGRDNLFPVHEHAESWDEDTLLDAVELYGQLVSRGDPDNSDSRFHDYGGCGWHYRGFTREPGFSEYRTAVNKVLARLAGGFVLNADGQVERLVDPALNDLALPASDATPLEGDDEKLVQGAIAKFRRRDLASRRDAVRDLADVLERLRIIAPGLMFKKDEGPLFEIANEYWIRHNKPDQAREYDHDVWWDWIFHLNLASIRLIQALQARTSPSAPKVDELVEGLGSMTWRKGLLGERLADLDLPRLPDDDQMRVGRAVGHRCVRETIVVIHDGLVACAEDPGLAVWPAAYRQGLLEGLFIDESGQLLTIPGVVTSAVRLLVPLPDADGRIEAFADGVVKRMFAAGFAPDRPREVVVERLRSACAQLPAGRQRDAWLRIAGRIEEVF